MPRDGRNPIAVPVTPSSAYLAWSEDDRVVLAWSPRDPLEVLLIASRLIQFLGRQRFLIAAIFVFSLALCLTVMAAFGLVP